MNDLTILITVTILLFTCLVYVLYKYGLYLDSLERAPVSIRQTRPRVVLSFISFSCSFGFGVFILAIAGLI